MEECKNISCNIGNVKKNHANKKTSPLPHPSSTAIFFMKLITLAVVIFLYSEPPLHFHSFHLAFILTELCVDYSFN